MRIQGAAISLEGTKFAVVLVPMDLLGQTGEADLTIETLQPTFGGVPVILMAQREDGSPTYYGDADLLRSLGDVPVDNKPWKEYSV